ncbi:uncharacterized protein LOC128019335 [Carassius gibelio]|uniref:uncharacterized protein LOC128019335 n=1 Tax=Carassius gibelio TaxID=101364 RepID=UPI0022794D42|nr:uncharacterized protein LOC128019335 [Carassius gibelio]
MADDEEEEVVVAPKIERKRDKESTMATRRGRPIKINPKYGAATDEVAPTIQIQFQNAKQTIEVQKQKILHLEDKVNSLTEERNYLRARLEDGKLPSSQSHLHTPEESLKRYYKVLNLVKQGLSKAEAYNRLNVDRNTIVIQAPIAESAAANPESFRKLRQMFKKGDSILKFAESCLCLCKEKANEDVIKQMKEANDLLDINKK